MSSVPASLISHGFPQPFEFFLVIPWLQPPLSGGCRKISSSKQTSGEKKHDKYSTCSFLLNCFIFHLLVWDNIDKGIKDTTSSPESNKNSHSQITEYDIFMFCNMKRKEHLIYFNVVKLKLD